MVKSAYVFFPEKDFVKILNTVIIYMGFGERGEELTEIIQLEKPVRS